MTPKEIAAQIVAAAFQGASFPLLLTVPRKKALEEAIASALSETAKELAETQRALCASEGYRRAYMDGKYKLYALGGEIAEAAADHLPMSEGPLERWVRWHILLPQHRMVVDDLHATALDWVKLEAALSEHQQRDAQVTALAARP